MQDNSLFPSFPLTNCQLALGRCGWGKAEGNGFPASHFVWHVHVPHQIAKENGPLIHYPAFIHRSSDAS